MKSLLHMGSLKAIVGNEELKSYYLRKTDIEKKPKMLVLNAIRNKMIQHAYACIKQNRLFVTPPKKDELITDSTDFHITI